MGKVDNIKLIASDLDGVWTDGSMYYGDSGEVMKRFSTYDGMAVELLRKAGLEVAILTGENSVSVAKRMEKLRITHYFFSQKHHKLATMKELVAKLGITLDEVAYIGDDVNDLELLAAVGFSGMPVNSPILDQFTADYVTVRKGGEGAFREFVEQILHGKK